jgi:hypothetical protein
MEPGDASKPRRNMDRKRKWILGAIGLLVFGSLSSLGYKYLIQMPMSPDLQQKAEQAFTTGITIEDEHSDFAPMGAKPDGEKPNNPVGYDLGFNDVRSLSLGTDGTYLYCKVVFWEMIPANPPILEDDKIGNTFIKINITDSQGVDQEIWMLGFGYLPPFNIPTVNTYYFYGPTGIQEPEDKRFYGRGSDGKIAGGAGYDYVIGALPLNRIGLSLDETMYLSLSVETTSSKYDHASVDVLGGQGKMPALITWKPGTSSYEIDQDFYQH